MGSKKRKRVTMADIANKLGISKNAVSLSLNNRPGVSEELRAQVWQMAKQMNYGKLPSMDSTNRSCIAVLVPEYIRNDSYFYSDIFWSIEHEARETGHATLMLGLSTEAEHKLEMPAIPDKMEVLGYLAIGIIRKEYMAALHALGRPIIAVDIHHNTLPISTIGTDNIGGAYKATDFLIRSGHTKIGFIGPIHVAQSVYERWCGFGQAIMDARLPLHEEYCILGSQQEFELLDNAEVLSKYIADLSTFPTAWFCAGDLIAVSLLSILNARGINVPQDISIMGFDNLKVSELVSPPLTTVDVDRNLIGKTAVRHLLKMTAKDHSRAYAHSLTCELVVRDSVRTLDNSREA